MIRLPPRSTRTAPLFPSPALFRSARMFGDSLRRHVAAPPWQRELRDWLRRRGQVVVLIQAQKQQAAMAPTAVRKLTARTIAALDRKSVVSGKSVSVRVDLGGRRIIKKKKRARTVSTVKKI